MTLITIWAGNLLSLGIFALQPFLSLRQLRTRAAAPHELWSIPVQIAAVTMLVIALTLRAAYGLQSANFYLQAVKLLLFAAGSAPAILVSMRRVFVHFRMQEGGF